MEKPEITEVVNVQMPLGTTLGMRTYGGAEEVDATLEWAAELCTAGGVLHGGVLMSLADAAGGVCAFLNLPPGATTVTIESKTNFLGVIREDRSRSDSLKSEKCKLKNANRETAVIAGRGGRYASP